MIFLVLLLLLLLFSKETGTIRRGCGGRRWTSLRQHSRPCSEQLVSGSTSTPSSTTTASPLPDLPKKSNWQVIEHYGSKDKNSLSSSLIAVSFSVFTFVSLNVLREH